jgi:hypothetical protein
VVRDDHAGLGELDAQQLLLLLDALDLLGYHGDEGSGATLGRFIARGKSLS